MNQAQRDSGDGADHTEAVTFAGFVAECMDYWRIAAVVSLVLAATAWLLSPRTNTSSTVTILVACPGGSIEGLSSASDCALFINSVDLRRDGTPLVSMTAQAERGTEVIRVVVGLEAEASEELVRKAVQAVLERMNDAAKTSIEFARSFLMNQIASHERSLAEGEALLSAAGSDTERRDTVGVVFPKVADLRDSIIVLRNKLDSVKGFIAVGNPRVSTERRGTASAPLAAALGGLVLTPVLLRFSSQVSKERGRAASRRRN